MSPKGFVQSILKKGGVLVSTRSAPSLEMAERYGVRALRFTVEADGDELADIAALVASGKVRPHVEQVFPLVSAADALALVEQGHALGKVMLKVV